MSATVQHTHDAKALYQSKVDEVKRLEAEGKAEALRQAGDAYQAWMRAHREAVEAHNAYMALPEENVSGRMGSAVQAAVLEQLPLESRLANLRQQYEQAVVEQARKRQGGDPKGADEALARSHEATLAMDKTQAELDSLVSKEPRLVGGRIAKHDLPLTNKQIANPPKVPDYVKPTTRGGSAVPPAPSTPKPPTPPASDVDAPASATLTSPAATGRTVGTPAPATLTPGVTTGPGVGAAVKAPGGPNVAGNVGDLYKMIKENVGEYSILGAKAKIGNTFHRRILDSRTSGRPDDRYQAADAIARRLRGGSQSGWSHGIADYGPRNRERQRHTHATGLRQDRSDDQ